MTLEEIETKFKECTKLMSLNLVQFPIQKKDHKEQKQETIKELSKKFGFVPTPIFLVDAMICMEIKNLKADSITCDFCSGVGQYTVRLLRYLKNKFDIDVEQFLINNHYLTELQPENCAALVYIFGPKINLYVGDSMNLKYSTEDDKGILFFNEKNKKWFNDTLIDKLLTKNDINTNREILSYIFNNYKHSKKIVEYIQNYDFEGYKKKQKEEKQVEVNEQIEAKEIVENTVLNDDKVKDESKSVQKENNKKSSSKKENKPKVTTTGTVRLKGSKKPSIKKRIHG